MSNSIFETPATSPRTDCPSTIIVKRPKRLGRCDMCGANCECNLPTVIGVVKSITSPIPHKTKRNGGGINAEIIHTTAAHRKPLVYLLIRGVAEEKDLLLPARIYSKTRIIRIAAYDKAKPAESLPKPQDTFTAKAAAPTICKSIRILCPKSSVSNLVA